MVALEVGDCPVFVELVVATNDVTVTSGNAQLQVTLSGQVVGPLFEVHCVV
jgi:hypothetical protein